ncbi:MAG: hypothetical protein V7636_1858 [Actinomycetota bacterium]
MLHVTQVGTYGVGEYVANLADVQVEAGWDVAVAGPEDGVLHDRIARSGATWITWDATRDIDSATLAQLRAFRSIVRRCAPDVVHLHSSKAGLVGRFALRGRVPTVFEPNGWSFFAVSGLRRRAAIAWERWAMRWTDLALCVCEDERAHAERAGVNGRFAVVLTAVDTERFAPSDRATARAELGLDDGPLAVCVGRLAVAHKGQDVLLRAWELVTKEVPAARLVLVGDGPDQAMLEASAPASVTFAGRRDDIERWYAAANVLVQPSLYEGLSITTLESLASGRSIVVTDCIGMREVVDGVGAIVPIGDAHALAAALVERLRDLDATDDEGSRGRQRALDRLHRDRWRREMLDSTLRAARR